MDNQEKATYCLNLPWQGSEKLGLGSTVPCMQPESYVVPDLSSLKPLSQAAIFYEAFKSTSLISPSCRNSQMFYAEGFAKPISVGVDVAAVASSAEEYRVGNGIEGSPLFSQVLESRAPFFKLEASVSRDQNYGANEQDLGARSGLHHEKMNLESSASYQKRFILFDQAGSTGRIIFHPSQFSMKEVNAPNMDRKEVTISKVPIEDNYFNWKAGCPENEETVVALAFAALQKTRASRRNSISLGNFGDELIPESGEGEVESTSRVSYHVLRQEKAPSSHSEMHEDTEDLEALLSSDNEEESSTGRSPSDITGNDGGNYVEDDFVDVTSGISMKRRRIDASECVEEDEVDLIPASTKDPLKSLMIDEKCLSPDISVVDTSSWEPLVVPEYLENVEDDNYNDDLFGGRRSFGKFDECSSKISANKRFKALKCFTRQSGLRRISRNENIKRTVEHLRSIIPGGNGMETAVVLDEAIQYVKVLQQKVKKMEANQQDVME